MFATLKQIFKPQNKDLRKRILFTLVCLFIFKLGTTIIVPGIDKDSLGTDNLGFLELINVMGGGAMEKFSIFSLGVMPYISASIIVQLLQIDIIPYFSELAKQGQVGRNKLNTITRYLGILIAFIQGCMYAFAFVQTDNSLVLLEYAAVLTAGTAFLLWLGDQITQKGIGNGISLIIMAGIIMTIPTMFMEVWNAVVTTGTVQEISLGVVTFIAFIIVYIAILLGVIFEETSERRIPIQYANKSTSAYGATHNYIPFKLNSAGVMPVIFASALSFIPGIIAGVIKNDGFQLFVSKYLSFNSGTGFALYIICIILFSYFYTFLQVKPKELSENLQKNGGYIPGIRPGEETVKYISTVLKRITIVGAIFLSVIAGLPIVFGWFSNLPTSVSIGGTGVIIIVGVALETYKQLESQLVTRSYTKGRRRY